MGSSFIRSEFRGVNTIMIIDTPPSISIGQIYSAQRRYNQASIPASLQVITGTSIYSTGIGVQIVSITDKMYIHVAAGLKAITGGSATFYLYRSTTGIPAQGSAPYAGDVQVATIASGVTTTGVAPNWYYIDTNLTSGQTYYYYIAGVNNTAGDGIGAYQISPSYPLFYENNASETKMVLEVLSV